jgi:polysaccharide biosynthesis/export protein
LSIKNLGKYTGKCAHLFNNSIPICTISGLESVENQNLVKTAIFSACRFIILPILAVLAACSGTAEYSGSANLPGPGTEQQDDLEIVANLPPPNNTNQGTDQLIAENDLLEVDIFEVNELDRTVQVDSRGNISLALIGAIEAKGRTIPELESAIEKKYGAQYLQNPEVSVFMKESSGQRITIDGTVSKPGIYAVNSNTTLLQIIALAGGFQEIADDTKLYVFRQYGEKKLVTNFNVKEIRAGKQRDPRIFGGDIIVSFPSGAKIASRNLREALGIATGALRIATPL